MTVTTDDQRIFIVRRLGLLDSYSQIVINFAAQFDGAPLHESEIEALDPTRGVRLSEMLLEVFKSNREYIVENFEVAAPTADKRVRLIYLHNLLRNVQGSNRPGSEARILAQIAAEQGNGEPAAAIREQTVTEITRTIVYPTKPAGE